MKSLEEKKLLVKMMRLFGQPVDQELVESIKREEELAKAFFGEVKESKIDVIVDAPVIPSVVENIVSIIPILKTDSPPGFLSALNDLSKEDLIDVIEEMTSSNINVMELYELDEKSLRYIIRELSKQKTEDEPEPEIIEKVEEPKVNVLQESILKEFEILSKKLDNLQKRFNNSIATGSGGGVVRMSDLDNLIAKQDIIPDQDQMFDLGSADRRFKDLYLSGNTIVLGTTTIGADAGGGLVIGDTVAGSNTTPVTITASAFKSAAAPIEENEAEVASSYTVSTNKYAKSVGPIKLNKSVVFKVPKTSKWKILA